ncbi:hypothetical protein RHMOL_Rhmol05G0064300 [Rhododendron molle]|uniref:Uncharacterized protein n=1 Tax=Rhododendron molle TaxID=49168 RepID=A0ACC0NL71_RHOML|nr:hypothetical protein RHMOL_Rhmol05G0064300 [Rhododendron molle]
MAKEQADSAVPPPPPFLENGRNEPPGMTKNLIERQAFWIERLVALLVLVYWVPPGVGDSFLIGGVFLLIFSNSLYLIAFISSRPLLPMVRIPTCVKTLYTYISMAKDRNDANAIQVAVLGAVTLVIATGGGIGEALRYGSLMRGMILVTRIFTGIAENLLERQAFWIERVAALLVLFYRVPPDVDGTFLIVGVSYLIFSNSLYLIAFISSRPLLPMMAKDRNDANAIQIAVLGTATLVIGTGVGIIEALRYGSPMQGMILVIAFWVAIYVAVVSLHAKYGRNKIIDEENTGQQEAELDLSSKESKEEVQANDEMKNKTDEEFTGQLKAKLDVVHGWEEERSQLMYELGAARASLEIYRELLHDLHHHHQP